MNKNFFKGEDGQRLLSNVTSLGFLQAVNYILPLLTIPYLVRVLGPEYFGLLAFSTAIITYFMLITDYGFNFSATRQISINRDDKEKIIEIFSSVMIVKFILLLLSLLILIFIVFTYERLREYWHLYFITFGTVVGQVLFPLWLFQGMEKMRYISYLHIGTKVFFSVCIFVFVQGQEDYFIVPLLTSFGFVVAGVISLIIAKVEFGVAIRWHGLKSLKFQVIDGWHVFLSTMSISLYTISSTFILGVFTNNTTVGYFSAADKIIQVIKGLYAPVSQAIYPLVSRKINCDRPAGIKFVLDVGIVICTLMFVCCFFLFYFSEPLVFFFLGDAYAPSVILLQIMAFLPLIITMSNILGVQLMLNLGFKKEFSFFVFLAAITGISLSILLTWLYDVIGISLAVLAAEIQITIMLAIFVFSKYRRGCL